jgi:sugar/nucleoside kinase (ribokinase family)
VAGLAPKNNIAAWVDRKAFIHNLGHATAAYYGHFCHPEAVYIYEVLDDAEVYAFTRSVMQQSAAVLLALYPADFTKQDLEAHIDDLLARFQNKALKDTVFRVGQDRMRKLSPDDRFAGVIRQAQKLQINADLILQALACAFFFGAKDHSGKRSATDFQFDNLVEVGIDFTLERVCGFDKTNDKDLILKIRSFIEQNKGKNKTETGRNGIISVGNWLVDKLKFIEKYPTPGNLTSIVREETGLGGCAHNVLVDLAKMKTGLPLFAGGCVGNDANGDYVMNEIQKNSLDFRYMNVISGISTSYTDVMIPLDGSSRTFFHNRGANALLDVEHFENIDVPAKIFHLGYLLLLDKLDADEEEYGVKAARILRHLQQKGYKTSIDVVSEEGHRFRNVIFPCLPYVDYMIVNEIEAGECFGKSLRDANGKILIDKVKEAVRFLLDKGVNEVCVVHFPEGGYAANKKGEEHFEASIQVGKNEIVSPVGAGDAFCAGMLYMLHEEKSLREALIFANTSARFNLLHSSSAGGAPTLKEINEFITKNIKK